LDLSNARTPNLGLIGGSNDSTLAGLGQGPAQPNHPASRGGGKARPSTDPCQFVTAFQASYLDHTGGPLTLRSIFQLHNNFFFRPKTIESPTITSSLFEPAQSTYLSSHLIFDSLTMSSTTSSTATSMAIPHHSSSSSGTTNPTPRPSTTRSLHRSVFSTSTAASSSSSSVSSSPKMPDQAPEPDNSTSSSQSLSPSESTPQRKEKQVDGSKALLGHLRRPSLLSKSAESSAAFITYLTQPSSRNQQITPPPQTTN
jgi:hypothetical protein